VTRHLDELQIAGRSENLTVHEVLWQESGEYTQLPGRFEAMMAQAGISRMRISHGGREVMVVSSLTMGRHASNDVPLTDRWASRAHARIERRKDKYVLVDLSSNGTFVVFDGGEEVRLRREELIMYGSGRISFGHPASEADAEVVGFKVE
jgi:pSer/pThr/pTyr-binding forkhead associated (FHA) protein